MPKTFFSGLEWERHCHQMGLAAGVEGEEGRKSRGGGGRERERRESDELAVRESEQSETQAL